MQIIKLSKVEEKPDNYDEMVAWYEKRTKMHINLVQKYAKKIEEYDYDRFKGLVDQTKDHDQSKFESPEKAPYVWISWDYKCKDDGKKLEIPESIKEEMNQATQHHVTHNKHHAEYYSPKKVDLINRKDRDKPPSEMVDATKMPVLSLGEMCADWMAMSEEKGTSCKSWADKNVNVRWKFTQEQVNLIYELIENIKVEK